MSLGVHFLAVMVLSLPLHQRYDISYISIVLANYTRYPVQSKEQLLLIRVRRKIIEWAEHRRGYVNALA